MSRETILTRDISDLCTDEIDLKFIEDVHALLGDAGTQTLLDRANAANDNVDFDLEKLIRYLDFFMGKAEQKLLVAGYKLDWSDSEYVIYREGSN